MKKNKGITLIALVITIIILLILAGVSIATLTGQNGLLSKANTAKQQTKQESAKEKIRLAIGGSFTDEGEFDVDQFEKEIENLGGTVTEKTEETITVEMDGYEAVIDIKTGKILEFKTKEESKEDVASPELWEITNKSDKEWYDYGNATINKPKLTGRMTPIKYVKESQTGNKWANAVTADGSMWVWIPRYAYKITNGYHTNSSTGGTIEVAFVDVNNNFLNGETGTILTDPSKVTYSSNVQNQWLVHPAFTSSAENGGGFGELEGLWISKFEVSGDTANLKIEPGVPSLRNVTVGNGFNLAKTSTFGETAVINSHMQKNSEWGAITYFAYSKYGTNKQKITQNTDSNYNTGGSDDKETIYAINKTQSTTLNATGVYDMHGGASEVVASYVNNGDPNLSAQGGTNEGDLYGANEEERRKSTAYKMVYESSGGNSQQSDYELTKKYKGDSIYEISNNYSHVNAAWFGDELTFPYSNSPFFTRDCYYGYDAYTSFFGCGFSKGASGRSFHVILAF